MRRSFTQIDSPFGINKALVFECTTPPTELPRWEGTKAKASWVGFRELYSVVKLSSVSSTNEMRREKFPDISFAHKLHTKVASRRCLAP